MLHMLLSCQNIRKIIQPTKTILNSYFVKPNTFFKITASTALNRPTFRDFHSTQQQKYLVENRVLDANTNVAKDVIIFKYENPRFYKILNIFAICQYLFWNYLAYFAFTTLKDAPIDTSKDEQLSWWRKINLGENKYRNTITIVSFLIGYGILAAAWMFTLRSVRFLILHKGGQSVSIVTYGPFNRNRMMQVPLKCISAQESRDAAKVHLPIKVKNKNFFYVLDMKQGEFKNAKLYDYTVGMKRKI